MKAVKKSYDQYGKVIAVFGLGYTAVVAIARSLIENSTFAFWSTYGVPGIILIMLVVYHLVRAPYEIYEELWDGSESERAARELDIKKLDQRLIEEQTARESAIAALRTEIKFIRTPRFEIQCGESTTQKNGRIYHDIIDGATGRVINQGFREIAFFGFRLWNRGAKTATKCRVRLVGIERNCLPILTDIGALGFEADNQGADLEEVDLTNDVPGRLSVFSIFHVSGEIAVGAGNLKWRHAKIHPLFKEVGQYDFVVSISYQGEGDDVKHTQQERFTFHWKGDCLKSSIQYRGPNVYVNPKTQAAIV